MRPVVRLSRQFHTNRGGLYNLGCQILLKFTIPTTRNALDTASSDKPSVVISMLPSVLPCPVTAPTKNNTPKNSPSNPMPVDSKANDFRKNREWETEGIAPPNQVSCCREDRLPKERAADLMEFLCLDASESLPRSALRRVQTWRTKVRPYLLAYTL